MKKYFQKLKDLFSSENIPTRDECFKLMDKYEMPEHIIQHSLGVTRVSIYIAKELNKKGHSLNLKLVEAGAMLHDIQKMESIIQKKGYHTKLGHDLILKLGYTPRLAEIVKWHVILDYDEEYYPKVTEAEVVNYADKRVKHHEIVTMEDRFNDILTRYGKTPKIVANINYNIERSEKLEEKIFSKLTFDKDEILKLKK